MQDYYFSEISKELTKFGLTKNQALIYITLVSIGKSSAREISQVSNIRREEVYRILAELEKLGLIEKILGRPSKFKAISPEKALSFLIDLQKRKLNKKIEELSGKREKLVLSLNNLAASNFPIQENESVSEFVLIYNVRTTFQRIFEMLKKGEKEILAIIPEEELFYLIRSDLMKEIRKILQSDIKFKIILYLGKFRDLVYDFLKKECRNLSKNIEVKVTEKIVLSLFIVDDKEAIIAVPERSGRGFHPDLWTDNREYVKRLRLLFEDHWFNSIDASVWMKNFEKGASQKRVEIITWNRMELYRSMLMDKVKKAKKEILFLSDYEGMLLANKIGICNALYKKIKKDKISVKGIIPVKDKVPTATKKLLRKITDIKYFDIVSPMLLAIMDKKEIILCTYVEHDKILLWSDIEYMVKAFESYFNKVWEKALSPEE